MPFDSYSRIWFLTWTSYGTWLPGDRRGFVSPKWGSDYSDRRRNNRIGTPYDSDDASLRKRSDEKLAGPPIWLSDEHAAALKEQFEETAKRRGWKILAAAIMANHIHVVVGVPGDPEPEDILRDFKSYGSGALNQHFGVPASKTWWTEQGSKRKIRGPKQLAAVLKYVLTQRNPLLVWQADED